MIYRGANITEAIYGGYEWEHPNYFDASFDDHWTTFGMGYENSIEECEEAIDEMFEIIAQYEDIDTGDLEEVTREEATGIACFGIMLLGIFIGIIAACIGLIYWLIK